MQTLRCPCDGRLCYVFDGEASYGPVGLSLLRGAGDQEVSVQTRSVVQGPVLLTLRLETQDRLTGSVLWFVGVNPNQLDDTWG